MIQHRPLHSLFSVERGWLKTKFHFIPPGMGPGPSETLGPLMAWNDDEVAPHSGFPEHPHENVEIITFVRDGAITHEDNLGNKGRATGGQIQAMSAGRGIRHSEYNRDDDPVTLFQIWLETRAPGKAPDWGTSSLPPDASSGGFIALASGSRQDAAALQIEADVRLLAARLAVQERIVQPITEGRAYLVPTRGTIRVNGIAIGPRDGCLVTDEAEITIEATEETEVVMIDLLKTAPGLDHRL
ncbi:pirin family protein [Allorhizobium undicola]|uniref:pirin family protein n=1 Tax=Allorhizobium undicola TaxID=78527 RepID=UPI000A00F0B6|nr:pirin family protein [Allorhizobium undicola]